MVNLLRDLLIYIQPLYLCTHIIIIIIAYTCMCMIASCLLCEAG